MPSSTMWLYLMGIAFLIIGVGGGFVGGGVFSFVFIPLGLIVLGWAVFSGMVAKRATERSGENALARPGSAGRALPHQSPAAPSSAPTTPEALVDERRVQQ